MFCCLFGIDTSTIRFIEGKDRDYDPFPVISALNLVLQQQAARDGVRVGQNRYFFPTSRDKFSLGPGVEARKGFYASVRPTLGTLVVNVNATYSAFYLPGKFHESIQGFMRNTHGAIPRKFSKDIKLTTTYLGYKKKKAITRLAGPANRTKFKCDEFGGRDITVEEYFKRSES